MIRDRQHLSTVKQTAGSDMWGEGNHILTGPCEQQKFIQKLNQENNATLTELEKDLHISKALIKSYIIQ